MTFGRIVSVIVLAAIIAGGLHYAGVIHLWSSGPAAPAAPAGPEDYYSKGQVAFHAGDAPHTVEYYTHALKDGPKDSRAVEAYFRMGRMYEMMHENKKAYDAYQKCLALNPESTIANAATRQKMLLESSVSDR